MTSELAIRLATRRDIPGLVALADRYYVGNLDPSEQANGFISIHLSEDWFARAVDSNGVHVAAAGDDAVLGFIAVTDPPTRAQVDPNSIIGSMRELAESLQFNGKPIAQQRFALRGPVCIDEAVRGRGIYNAFNAITSAAYRDRFDLGMLFVAADNPRSLHTTANKLGAESLAVFDVDSRRYHFLAFTF